MKTYSVLILCSRVYKFCTSHIKKTSAKTEFLGSIAQLDLNKLEIITEAKTVNPFDLTFNLINKPISGWSFNYECIKLRIMEIKWKKVQ